MGKALAIERVRSDVEVLARAGLDVSTFLAEVDASLGRAVPYEAMCVALQDPATSMATATFKFGGISGRESHDLHWCEVEFGGADATSFRALTERGVTAVGMHHETGGDVGRSVRMRDFMRHHFGFTDELRTVARVDDRDWAALAMMRADAVSPFDDAEIALMASLSGHLATGIRAGVLARCAESAATVIEGPAVIIVDRDGSFAQVNPAAAHWLAELGRCDNSEAPVHTLAALIDGARRYARGEADTLPRCRVRVPTGTWLVLNGSPLSGPAGAGGDIVITIEQARPPEIVPLVVAAFALTPRERDVTQLVLQGVPSKEVAATLHISVHTVQDHLKSIFEKADVRSRRELIARVFFDQYLPRFGDDVSPSGWFA
ncbi:helix-turn-helix transcriptional regulator [Acidimicrobiia bacterium EGI L10123]|uniref:helix-turn-helix transcriptional regulator n=1 Tax=Salinilacustrithrix flava TaxID=2957203 RepID=UPI003D7C1CF7|nr:helix-turn-helix transcriptional regulator [Acidimicrobiia bacterium EGI L10123]